MKVMALMAWTGEIEKKGKSMRKKIVAAVLAAAALSLTPAQARTVVIELGSGGFDEYSPSEVTIDLGDTVQWLWVQGFHNVVSGVDGDSDGIFTSGRPIRKDGMTFEVTFDQAFLDAHPMPQNIYPFYCDLHFFFGMSGSITVKAAPACPADLDDSGHVGGLDLAILLGNWTGASTYESCPPPAPADLNGDCKINGLDLAVLLAAWGDCR